MKIAAVGLLAPFLVRAAQLHEKDDENVGAESVSLQVAPGINSEFLLVDLSKPEPEEEGDETTTPAVGANDWSVLGGRDQFSIPEERIVAYGKFWSFFDFLAGPPQSVPTKIAGEYSEQQISELMEISNFDAVDFNIFIDSKSASLSTIYAEVKKTSSMIGVLQEFLRLDRGIYEKFLDRNFEALQKDVIDPASLRDLVITLIYGKSFDKCVEVIKHCSRHSISVDSVVAAVLSTNSEVFYEMFTNPAVLNASCLNWACFDKPAESERFKAILDFALESPVVLKFKPEFIARLMQDGADPSFNNYASVKVAAKNKAFESFKLLVEGRQFDAEVASEVLKLAIDSRCYPIISFITKNHEVFPAEASFSAYFSARQNGDEEMLQALGGCPLVLSAKKFADFMQILDVSDEEFMVIINRRSPNSTASYYAILKSLAHREKAELFMSLLSIESVVASLNVRDLTYVLNFAIAKCHVDAVKLLSSLPRKKFGQEFFSTFGLLNSGNMAIIDLVKPLKFKWYLTNDEALSLAQAQAWDSLTAYISYKPQPDIFSNSVSILRLAFDQDQVAFVKACLAANLVFPKNPLTLAKCADMKALFSVKKSIKLN